ncbi:hypothetical protein WN55_04281 [Dufourea novaeangliae]|uniref:Uncharacterized protein n=1 Tax=Dufourea novaeangliae TaxID=178035 RepID=A0A154PNF7_DUFNO|nr:hypothetical protein WN55_04281 [Dufourea novaeangliae]
MRHECWPAGIPSLRGNISFIGDHHPRWSGIFTVPSQELMPLLSVMCRDLADVRQTSRVPLGTVYTVFTVAGSGEFWPMLFHACMSIHASEFWDPAVSVQICAP